MCIIKTSHVTAVLALVRSTEVDQRPTNLDISYAAAHERNFSVSKVCGRISIFLPNEPFWLELRLLGASLVIPAIKDRKDYLVHSWTYGVNLFNVFFFFIRRLNTKLVRRSLLQIDVISSQNFTGAPFIDSCRYHQGLATTSYFIHSFCWFLVSLSFIQLLLVARCYCWTIVSLLLLLVNPPSSLVLFL